MSQGNDNIFELLKPTKAQIVENIIINITVNLCWLFRYAMAHDLGLRIRKERLRAKLRLQPIANMLDIQKSALVAFELGKKVPNGAMLYNIFAVMKYMKSDDLSKN